MTVLVIIVFSLSHLHHGVSPAAKDIWLVCLARVCEVHRLSLFVMIIGHQLIIMCLGSARLQPCSFVLLVLVWYCATTWFCTFSFHHYSPRCMILFSGSCCRTTIVLCKPPLHSYIRILTVVAHSVSLWPVCVAFRSLSIIPLSVCAFPHPRHHSSCSMFPISLCETTPSNLPLLPFSPSSSLH